MVPVKYICPQCGGGKAGPLPHAPPDATEWEETCGNCGAHYRVHRDGPGPRDVYVSWLNEPRKGQG